MQIKIRPKHQDNQGYAAFAPNPGENLKCRCGENKQQAKANPCGAVQAKDLAAEANKLMEDKLVPVDDDDF